MLIPERLVLASASPRRRQLFSLLEVPFAAVAADVDEEIEEGESPQEMVCRLSLAKAKAVALSCPEDLIVAADTTVGSHAAAFAGARAHCLQRSDGSSSSIGAVHHRTSRERRLDEGLQ